MKITSLQIKIWITLLWFFFSSKVIQAVDPFAYLIDIQHVCTEEGLGSVEFGINGDPGEYIWHWSTGATELSLDGLPIGLYTLYVENIYGCIEEYPVEIIVLDNCEISYDILPTEKPCFVIISVSVSANGVVLDEQALDITWNDNVAAGLERLVPVPEDQTADVYCIDVDLIGSEGLCCSVDACIIINGDAECDKGEKAAVVVNEFNRSPSGDKQFIELLVLGNGECEETVDLRGFLIDDNNGELIQANDFVNEYNYHQIGIDNGYLAFSFNDSWSAIPNGSLIVVYDELGSKHPLIPSDDPEDSDHDGVYILSADASNYFYAKTGEWNAQKRAIEYIGTIQDPSWAYLNITPNADGIQIRYPDGSFCHGLSKGSNSFSTPNEFDLYLGNESIKSDNCRLIGIDYMDAYSYVCQSDELNLQSPGYPNSQENALKVFKLMNCEDSENELKRRETFNLISSVLSAYPNPSSGFINFDYFSILDGQVDLRLLTVSGQNIHQEKLLANQGNGLWEWEFPTDLPAGLYLIEILFPSGEKSLSRISLIK